MSERRDAGCAWWREAEVAFLIAFVAAVYGLRLSALPIRGEEPRWFQVAYEMECRGDWIVPREQGDVFPSRPPLHSWLIAASCTLFGTRDAWAVRLPSVLAMLLTTVLVYGYSRTALSRLGALSAAVAFATFGELFQTGRLAETEATFILLVSASLLLWHWGLMRDWPAPLTWVAGYSLMALAVLTKGPQPPVYFLGSVSLYLILTGQVRRLFTASHLLGILAGCGIIALWAVPCYWAVGWANLRGIVLNDTASRFNVWQPGEVAAHLARFPLEVLGCTLPWSLLLVAYGRREFRESLGAARPQVLFTALAAGLGFCTCWLPPGGLTRYVTPLYPCLAFLIGLVVQRIAEAGAASSLALGWRYYSRLMAGAMVVAALAIAVGPLLASDRVLKGWAAPPSHAVLYGGFLAALAAVVWIAGRGVQTGRVRFGVIAIAGCMGVLFTGVATEVRQRRAVDLTEIMAELRATLPAGQRLVSFRHVDALFAYHLGRPIDWMPGPESADEVPTDLEYFCVGCPGDWRPRLPFEWDEIAAVPMDRISRDAPQRVVVVGRRLSTPP